MTTENGFRAFSVRLPQPLADQIDARCAVTRRTRNAEIQLLLEQALDAAVMHDRKMLDAVTTLR